MGTQLKVSNYYIHKQQLETIWCSSKHSEKVRKNEISKCKLQLSASIMKRSFTILA